MVKDHDAYTAIATELCISLQTGDYLQRMCIEYWRWPIKFFICSSSEMICIQPSHNLYLMVWGVSLLPTIVILGFSIFCSAWKLPTTEAAVPSSAEWTHHQQSSARGRVEWFWQPEGSWHEKSTQGQSHNWWYWSVSRSSYSQDFGESPLKARQKQTRHSGKDTGTGHLTQPSAGKQSAVVSWGQTLPSLTGSGLWEATRGHYSLCFPSWVQNSWRQSCFSPIVQSHYCSQREL